jgi:hypothetical protein
LGNKSAYPREEWFAPLKSKGAKARGKRKGGKKEKGKNEKDAHINASLHTAS